MAENVLLRRQLVSFCVTVAAVSILTGCGDAEDDKPVAAPKARNTSWHFTDNVFSPTIGVQGFRESYPDIEISCQDEDWISLSFNAAGRSDPQMMAEPIDYGVLKIAGNDRRIEIGYTEIKFRSVGLSPVGYGATNVNYMNLDKAELERAMADAKDDDLLSVRDISDTYSSNYDLKTLKAIWPEFMKKCAERD